MAVCEADPVKLNEAGGRQGLKPEVVACDDVERKHVGRSVGHERSRGELWRLSAQRGDGRSPACSAV